MNLPLVMFNDCGSHPASEHQLLRDRFKANRSGSHVGIIEGFAMKISVAICIYNDFDFIEECVNRVYDFADEIVILDGPYGYCEPMLKYFDLHYQGLPEPLREIAKRPKVRYEFRIFENEKAKRIALYEMCLHELVMLLDSDELIVAINKEELERFRQSDKAVASAGFNNLVRSNCRIGGPTAKFIFFKRSDVNAEEHLNYTWLVGVDQEKPNAELMYRPPIMEMAHLTLMRSPYFNVVKYCFYTRLFYYSRAMHDQEDRLFGQPFEALAGMGLELAEIKDIFRRSLPALINFPENESLTRISLPTINPMLDRLMGNQFLSGNQRVRLLNSVESHHYLKVPEHLRAGDAVHISFTIRDIDSVEVTLVIHDYQARTSIPFELETPRAGEVHGTCVLSVDAAKLFGALIKFKARCSDPNRAGTITNFAIKRRFAIYGNCQTETLRDFLLSSNAFNRQHVFEETPGRLVHMMSEQDIQEFHDRLYRIDYLISQPIGDNFGGSGNRLFGTTAIVARLRRDAQVIMFPNLFFTGYAPDSYCVTYRKKFMQRPMPVHDVNFIYSYLKHHGERESVSADYAKKLSDPAFYSVEFIRDHVAENIAELEAREVEASEKFKSDNVRFFPYSGFVAEWHDKILLHYSDAHPTEFVFDKFAEKILDFLGLENDLKAVVVAEKGVLPFYRSIDLVLGIDACATPIYLNNREVTFDEYFTQYSDEYDKIGARALFGYVSRNVTKVVVTNHKTGTLLMESILREYCARYNLRLLEMNDHLATNNARFGLNLDDMDPEFNYQAYDFIFITNSQHFERLVKASPNLRYRVIHLIRNPYEIIMSGVRYHQITDEQWCNKKLFVADARGTCGFKRIAQYDADVNGLAGECSYRDIMRLLPDDQKIEFEIRNHGSTFGTINCIASFLKRFRTDGNVSTVRLEDIATEECINHVFEFLSLNEDFLESYRSKVSSRGWLGRHVTNTDGKDTHQRAFSERMYDLFAAEFGSSVADDFGYGGNSPPPKYSAVTQESSAGVSAGFPADVTDKAKADELYELGDTLLESGELNAAREAFEGSLRLDGNRLGTLGRLGDVNVQLRRYQEALGYYGRIGRLVDVVPVWVNIGLANAYEALGQRQAAISNLKVALTSMPDSTILQSRLEALEASVT